MPNLGSVSEGLAREMNARGSNSIEVTKNGRPNITGLHMSRIEKIKWQLLVLCLA